MRKLTSNQHVVYMCVKYNVLRMSPPYMVQVSSFQILLSILFLTCFVLDGSLSGEEASSLKNSVSRLS